METSVNFILPDHEEFYKWSLETDITKWALRFACDMITIVVTGERSYLMASYYNILSNKKVKNSNTAIEDPERFIQGIKNHLSGFTYFLYFSPFLHYHIPFIKDQVKATLKNWDYLFKIIDLIIEKRRKEIEEILVGDELRNDMLITLIVTNTVRDINRTNNGRDNISRPITDDKIRANLLDSFQDGIDTTANTFSFIVYYICKHHHVKKKIVDEIDSIFLSKTFFHLKYDDLLKLEYCDAIINENLNNKVRNKFSLLTFGGGLRICPGRRLAIIELLFLMVILFGKYEVELVDMNAPLKVKSKATTTCGELPIKIKLRK
ncbi:cytochrome P450 [Gigaspora margarita]|uniref:Cytochrome P450 n=1 Tax=Gigaspora margarita TaxID=4874 RepID=A0A8H3WY36_GIGMA|nr:cytochrome P450 [Gigaspora margarita]